jgi:hypothetical protein
VAGVVHDRRRHTAIGRRIGRRETTVDRVDLLLRALHGRAIAQPRDRAAGDSSLMERGTVGQRQPEVLLVDKDESCRHHADDRRRRAVLADAFATRGGSATATRYNALALTT